MIPYLTDSSKRLIGERDSLRRLDHTDLHISTLDAQITHDIHTSKRQVWINTVKSCSHKHNPNTILQTTEDTIRKLHHHATQPTHLFPPHHPHQPPGNTTTFNEQFTTISPIPPTPVPDSSSGALIRLPGLLQSFRHGQPHNTSRHTRTPHSDTTRRSDCPPTSGDG